MANGMSEKEAEQEIGKRQENGLADFETVCRIYGV